MELGEVFEELVDGESTRKACMMILNGHSTALHRNLYIHLDGFSPTQLRRYILCNRDDPHVSKLLIHCGGIYPIVPFNISCSILYFASGNREDHPVEAEEK